MCFCTFFGPTEKKKETWRLSGGCQKDAVILRSKCSCRMVENNSRTDEGTTVEKADDWNEEKKSGVQGKTKGMRVNDKKNGNG